VTWKLLSLCLLLVLPVAAQPLRVLVTFAPLAEPTRAVIGERGEVQILIKPGLEVHDYQSRPEDVLKIRRAQVLVKNGLGLETFLSPLLANAEASQLVTLDSSLGITPIAHNPHLWLSPKRARQQLQRIVQGLSQIDPINQALYHTNAQMYDQRLRRLDQHFQAKLAPYRNRNLIALDTTFAYLAQDYQLRLVSLLPQPETALTPQLLRIIFDRVKHEQLTTILTPPSVDNRILVMLRDDLGVRAQTLNTLENGGDYFAVMEQNLELITRALSEKRPE
jgi:zinc/manganese transport system substrate-binding protein